jgi:hypothetical protein
MTQVVVLTGELASCANCVHARNAHKDDGCEWCVREVGITRFLNHKYPSLAEALPVVCFSFIAKESPLIDLTHPKTVEDQQKAIVAEAIVQAVNSVPLADGTPLPTGKTKPKTKTEAELREADPLTPQQRAAAALPDDDLAHAINETEAWIAGARLTLDACKVEMMNRLVERGARKLDLPTLTVELEQGAGSPEVIDAEALYVKLDATKLVPATDLHKAIVLFQPPVPAAYYKTNVTHLKKIGNDYGFEVKAIVERHIVRTPKPPKLVVKLKTDALEDAT